MKKFSIFTMCLPVICMLLFLSFSLKSQAQIIYTTDAKTNAVAEKIIRSCTNDQMTQEEKLRSVYYYLVHKMKYSWSTGRAKIKVTKQEIEETKKLGKSLKVSYSREFKNRYKNVASLQGTCYGQNKVFCILANHLGYTAHIVHGSHVTGGSSSDHYWCYLIMDGKKKYFDVQYANRCYHRNKKSKEVEKLYKGSGKDKYWRKHYHH